MARRKRRSGAVVLVALVAIAVAVVAGPRLLERYGDRWLSQERCTVTLGSQTSQLTAEQADNAALIAAGSFSSDLPHHAATVALAAAIQESDLRNITYGDRDSLGLFQQRPSQGWGTEAEILDRHHATHAFYAALREIDGWEDLTVTQAAQAVQRSALPTAYADHEADARLWARVLTGEEAPTALSCRGWGAAGDDGAAADLAARARADFGSSLAVSPAGARMSLTSARPDVLSAAAAWAVSLAEIFPVSRVEWCGATWADGAEAWDATSTPSLCTDPVVVTLRTQ